MRVVIAIFGAIILLSYITFGYLKWYPGRYQYIGIEEGSADWELVNPKDLSQKKFVPFKVSSLVIFDKWTGKAYSFVEDMNLLLEVDVIGKRLHGQILTGDKVVGLPEAFEKIERLHPPK